MVTKTKQIMTNQDKLDLQRNVVRLLAEGKTHSDIIKTLEKEGYQKATIKNYIKSFS